MKMEDIEILLRYINGKADENEKSLVNSFFLNGEDNSDLFGLLKKDWYSLLNDNSASSPDLSHLLDHIYHDIRKEENMQRQNPLQKILLFYMRTAAILLLPLIIGGGLVFGYLVNRGNVNSDQTVSSIIHAPLGSRVSFSLPDGSIGMLNSGSSLSYSMPFSNNRNVILDGEAWFDIKKDKDNPFEISVSNSTIKVLGTSFNVCGYSGHDYDYIEVVLQQGKIEFIDNKKDKGISIMPSEKLLFLNGNIEKSYVDPSKYIAWTDGKLVFRGDLMTEVVLRLERWYNVTIELADKELESYSFRATFEDDKLEDVLKLLSMTSPIRYKIIPRKILEDGTYEKEKVTFYLNKELLTK